MRGMGSWSSQLMGAQEGGDGHGVEMDDLERGHHGVGGRREVEPRTDSRARSGLPTGKCTVSALARLAPRAPRPLLP